MINVALTRAMRKKKKIVIKFLDEALIQDNPLAIFGSMQKFSENPDFVNYHFKTADPIMSVADEYEKIVKSTVLQELALIETVRLKREAIDSTSPKGELTKAEIVDFAVLIHQHFYSLVYFDNGWGIHFALKIIFTAIEFPRLAFDAYNEAVREGNGRENSKQVFKKLSENVKQANIYAFASFSNFYQDFLPVKAEVPFLFKDLKYRYAIVLDSSLKNHHFLRLKMISLISKYQFKYGRSWNVVCNEVTNILFDYHVFKSGDNLYNDLIVSLIGPLSFEVLNELKTKIRLHYYPNGDSVISDGCDLNQDLNNCIIDGSLETIKFLVEISSEHIKVGNILLRSGQLEIMQYLFNCFWDRVSEYKRRKTLKWALTEAPFEFFRSLYLRCSETERKHALKTGSHLLRIRQVQEKEATDQRARDEARKQRLLKKEAVRVQREREAERMKEKKDTMKMGKSMSADEVEAVIEGKPANLGAKIDTSVKAGARATGTRDGAGRGSGASRKTKPVTSSKRQFKNKTFGFGEKEKKMAKRNSRESVNDSSSFSVKKMKASFRGAPAGGKKFGNKPSGKRFGKPGRR